ncbi:hypothetical protein HNQ03_001403 [Chryseobacterium sp. 16F]|uniref:Uncharacterized protein n=1 Tax=Frigoriflavimonas asaccharolytica TaxID=2735899 RepID=A0A8J8GAE5_9FLAO|nr:hypothetical protein [Frigoriflavimonas asaccharolytica]
MIFTKMIYLAMTINSAIALLLDKLKVAIDF